MTLMHTLPDSPDKSLWLNHPEPVKVQAQAHWGHYVWTILAGRHNLLSMWPKSAYRMNTFAARFLRQHYFVCNSPDTVKQVFLTDHDNYDRKSPQMRNALEPLLGDGLFVSDGDLWKERRAYCAPAFENELLPYYARIMTECCEEVLTRWSSLPASTEVDMLNEMARLTARIIGRTVFGDDTTDEEAAQVVAGFSEYQHNIDQLSLADTFGIPLLRKVTNPIKRHKCNVSGKQVHEVIDRIIARQEARQNTEPSSSQFSLISLFVDGYKGKDARLQGCPLSRIAARNEAIVMFMAGHETTANVLAWSWYLLNHDARVEAKLHEELDRVLGGRQPTLDDVPNLPYTRAIFEETMRLYPPVPLLTRQAREEDLIRNRLIEKDSIILVIPWLLHRHVEFWEAPDHFIPERFMPDNSRPDKFTYLPFSVGRRVCLGMRFGLTEGILCIATLAQAFKARVKTGHDVNIECRLTLRPKNGLPMRLSKR